MGKSVYIKTDVTVFLIPSKAAWVSTFNKLNIDKFM